MERFPGYTLQRIRDELDEDQIDAMLAFIAKVPAPNVRMVDWK